MGVRKRKDCTGNGKIEINDMQLHGNGNSIPVPYLSPQNKRRGSDAQGISS